MPYQVSYTNLAVTETLFHHDHDISLLMEMEDRRWNRIIHRNSIKESGIFCVIAAINKAWVHLSEEILTSLKAYKELIIIGDFGDPLLTMQLKPTYLPY